MPDTLEELALTVGNVMASPSLGGAELLVAVLMACGFVLLAVSSLLPKDNADKLEWWER